MNSCGALGLSTVCLSGVVLMSLYSGGTTRMSVPPASVLVSTMRQRVESHRGLRARREKIAAEVPDYPLDEAALKELHVPKEKHAMHTDVVIVIPGDHPPQLQGSPHLQRLKSHGEVVLHVDRPATFEEQVRRAGNAVCLINSRGAVKWPGDVLRRLPRLKMITVCGIGTDAIDLTAARDLGIT